jgi:hypothetical protein
MGKGEKIEGRGGTGIGTNPLPSLDTNGTHASCS